MRSVERFRFEGHYSTFVINGLTNQLWTKKDNPTYGAGQPRILPYPHIFSCFIECCCTFCVLVIRSLYYTSAISFHFFFLTNASFFSSKVMLTAAADFIHLFTFLGFSFQIMLETANFRQKER